MRLAFLVDYAGTGCGEGLAQHLEIPDVIRQQQNQSGVQQLALFLREAAMGMEQRFVELVRTSEMRFGDECHDAAKAGASKQAARDRAERTAFTSRVRHLAFKCWSGRNRYKEPGVAS